MVVLATERNERDGDVQVGRPAAMRLDSHRKAEAALIDCCRRRGRDPGLAVEGFPHVPEDETIVLDALVVLALLLQSVLDLKEIREVIPSIHPNLHLDG